MITNPFLRALADRIALDPDGPHTDEDLERAIAGKAQVTYRLDGNEQIVATIEVPE